MASTINFTPRARTRTSLRLQLDPIGASSSRRVLLFEPKRSYSYGLTGETGAEFGFGQMEVEGKVWTVLRVYEHEMGYLQDQFSTHPSAEYPSIRDPVNERAFSGRILQATPNSIDWQADFDNRYSR